MTSVTGLSATSKANFRVTSCAPAARGLAGAAPDTPATSSYVTPAEAERLFLRHGAALTGVPLRTLMALRPPRARRMTRG